MTSTAPTSTVEVAPSSRKAPPTDMGSEPSGSFREVLLEMRRGQDSFRREIVGAIARQTEATQEISEEIRELRKASPHHLAHWLVGGMILMSLVALFALASSRGVDVAKVADAVHLTVSPSNP